MRRKVFSVLAIFIIVLILCPLAYAVQVNTETALETGKKFIEFTIQESNRYTQPDDDFLQSKESQLMDCFSPQSEVSRVVPLENDAREILAYVLEFDPGGYIVVSSDTDIHPIIAYAYDGQFPFEEAVNNGLLHFVKWDMANRLEAIPLQAKERIAENNDLWDDIDRYLSGSAADTWGPHIKTWWDQRAPWDKFVPVDLTLHKISPVGCTATAMAQIINYWKYPGSVSFGNSDKYTTTTRKIKIDEDYLTNGFLSFDELNKRLSKIQYNDNSAEQAALCFAVGISVKMDYTGDESGAYPSDVAPAFKGKFKYKSADSINSSTSGFYDTLQSNMKDAKPALLAIYKVVSGKTYGHAIVCDGYKSTGEYHLNFGWGVTSPSANPWYYLPSGMPSGYQTVGGGVLNIDPKGTLPTSKVTYPNGGETWMRGKRYTITWDKGNFGSYVKIYLYKGSSSKATISSATSNDGSYSWTVPTSVGTGSDYRIKVQSYYSSSIYDYSDTYFKIGPDGVTYPNGGETWTQGKPYTITWDRGNFGTYVRIFLYEGNSWKASINMGTSNDGSYSWTVPTSVGIGNDYRIKVQSYSNSSIYDYSDTYFTIRSDGDSGKVTYPNGGETWTQGKPYTITWDRGNFGTYVRIFLYEGNSWKASINMGTSNDGSYSWTVPTSVGTGSDYRIKVQSYYSSSIYDYSDTYFTIRKDSEGVTYPNGGETWDQGKPYTIRWDKGNFGTYVKIYLYKGSTQKAIVSSITSNDSSYSWTVPTTVGTGSDYRVKVRSYYNSSIYDYSDTYFTIRKDSEGVTYPNGGETWNQGKSYTVRWGKGNFGSYVRIYLYKGGSAKATVSSKTSNDGSYSWTVPTSVGVGSDYLIKVQSYYSSSIYDYSDTYFTIRKDSSTKWGVINYVCCSNGSFVFSGTIDGTTKRSSLASCSSTPTWEGYATTSPGRKTFRYTFAGCGVSASGSWTPSVSLESGKCYVFCLRYSNSQIYIELLLINSESPVSTLSDSSVLESELIDEYVVPVPVNVESQGIRCLSR